MLINYSNILKIIPIIKLELFGKEYSFLVKTNLLKNILLIFKNHYKYQFKIIYKFPALLLVALYNI